MGNPIIFLDKDGTLIEDVPYNVDPEKIHFQPGAAKGLRRLAEVGFNFVIVTNQAGIARGYFSEAALEPVEKRIREMLQQEAGIDLQGFYYCPHHPDGCVPRYTGECHCRKPLPGMLIRAAHDLEIELEASWMIGDILNDVEAGKRAGCKTIFIDNGSETEWVPGPLRTPDFRVSTLEEAAEVILLSKRSAFETGDRPLHSAR